MVHTGFEGGGTLIFVCVLSGGDGQKKVFLCQEISVKE